MTEQDPAQPNQADRREQEAQGQDAPAPPAEDRTYDAPEVEVTRGRMQGLGVGEQDIQRQRDPTRGTPERRDQPAQPSED